MPLKILIVFGTRPEAIKMAPLIKKLKKEQKGIETIVCVTGQHRQMVDQVLSALKIKPDYDLNIMKSEQDLYDITSNVLNGIKTVLKKEAPDIVLVHGDTTTTFSASVASFYQQIPVGHVEAGLRTGKIYSPWPEEMNRKLTGAIASIHFAPTQRAKENLLKENIKQDNIFVTGNTVIDALLYAIEYIKTDKTLIKKFDKQFSFIKNNRKLILVTGHRRENFGSGFDNICRALKHLGERNDVQIVYPVHLNPYVQELVNRVLCDYKHIYLMEPLDYLPFIYLMNRSYMIITDSGGIQEEAPSIGKPVLITRETTERPEAVDAGTVKLVGTDYESIINESEKLLDDRTLYQTMQQANNPYGDGTASTSIINILKQHLL